MKRIFLASNVSVVLDLFVKHFKVSPTAMTVAFVPTAANTYEDKAFVVADRTALTGFGFEVFDIDIENEQEISLREKLHIADILFVAGGNTFYLLDRARKSGFDRIVRELVDEGKYYIGSSAGAVIAGPTIEPVKSIDDSSQASDLDSFEGFHLLDKVVIPHADHPKYAQKIQDILSDYQKQKGKIIALNENQALIISNRGEMIGTQD